MFIPTVSRIDAESEAYSTALTLDVNMEVFPLLESEKIDVLLCETLEDRDSTTAPTDATKARTYDPSRPLGQRAHEYDYIMSGKIFKYVQHKEHSYV